MASPLRIVYVSWEYPPLFGGGIGSYVHAITRVLAARGHRVTVITVGRDFAPQREILDGVTVLRLPVLCAGTGPEADFRSWQLRSQAVADALRALCRTGVDLIEFADYRGEGVQFLSQTAPGSRPACIVRLHAPLCVLAGFSHGQARNPALEELELEAIRLSDRIVSPSRVLAEHVLRHLAPVERSIDNNPYPADPVFLDAGAGRDPAASNEVLFVGRYQELKGAETLIRAAAAFLNECPTARLTMLGGDTDRVPGESMKQHVQRLVPREHADRIQLLDRMPRAKLIERYAAARLCVFPSHFENFPNTCLEAMSVGRPVIGTCQTGMQEIIEDGISGFLVPPQNVEALATALTRVFRLPADELRRIGAAARSRMMTAFHPDVIAGQIEQLYGGYLAGRSSAKCTSAAETTAAVAIVIPCFNHGQFVGEAVAAARAQTHTPIEIVVVDDGSTDPATLEMLDTLRRDGVRVLRQDNAGLAAARNAGIRATTAPFFVPLDADDRIEADFVAALLPSLLADATLGYAYANVRTFGDAESTWDCPDYDPKKLLVENLSVATAVIRREAFEQVGGYSADMVHGYEDWDFWIALLAAGWRGVRIPRPLFWYRKHSGGSMLDKTHPHREAMRRRIIEHHPGLFAAAWPESASEYRVEAGEIYQRLLTEAELSHIENSRLWRTVQRVRRWAAYRILQKLSVLPASRPEGTDAADRLQRIKSSLEYRMIQRLKRSWIYRRYADRKYGPDMRRLPQ